jgi:hypothetical protein
MGLWLKSNGVLVPVGGSGGGEGGPHVLTGDPENPPPELELDQLLYDGVGALWLSTPTGLVPVGGDDGEHVLEGDPAAPPLELEVGQLLYDPNAAGPDDIDTTGKLMAQAQWDAQVQSVVEGTGWNNLAGLEVTFPAVAGRSYVARATVHARKLGGDGTVYLRTIGNGSALQAVLEYTLSSGHVTLTSETPFHTPGAGDVTYQLQGLVAGVGNAEYNNPTGSGYWSLLMVYDVGAL